MPQHDSTTRNCENANLNMSLLSAPRALPFVSSNELLFEPLQCKDRWSNVSRVPTMALTLTMNDAGHQNDLHYVFASQLCGPFLRSSATSHFSITGGSPVDLGFSTRVSYFIFHVWHSLGYGTPMYGHPYHGQKTSRDQQPIRIHSRSSASDCLLSYSSQGDQLLFQQELVLPTLALTM